MTEAEIHNARLSEKCRERGTKDDRETASFLRTVLAMDDMSDAEKIAQLDHYVSKKRKEFDKFERSQPWEDE